MSAAVCVSGQVARVARPKGVRTGDAPEGKNGVRRLALDRVTSRPHRTEDRTFGPETGDPGRI